MLLFKAVFLTTPTKLSPLLQRFCKLFFVVVFCLCFVVLVKFSFIPKLGVSFCLLVVIRPKGLFVLPTANRARLSTKLGVPVSADTLGIRQARPMRVENLKEVRTNPH